MTGSDPSHTGSTNASPASVRPIYSVISQSGLEVLQSATPASKYTRPDTFLKNPAAKVISEGAGKDAFLNAIERLKGELRSVPPPPPPQDDVAMSSQTVLRKMQRRHQLAEDLECFVQPAQEPPPPRTTPRPRRDRRDRRDKRDKRQLRLPTPEPQPDESNPWRHARWSEPGEMGHLPN
jgi:hypothetical protein